MSPAEQAERYERYISENWNSLSAFEQEQAKVYLQQKYQAQQQAAFPTQPGFGQQSPYAMSSNPQGYASMYGDPYYGGYGPGAFGPPKKEESGGWAVWAGYVGVLIFLPLALFCGIFNCTKGRAGHGIAQLLLAILVLWVNLTYVF